MSRLSRSRFVALSGTAFLAACSAGGHAGGSLPSVTRALGLSKSTRPAYSFADADMVFHANRAGNAFAAYTRAGQFVSSCAVSNGFTRITDSDGTQHLLDRARPLPIAQWRHFKNKVKVKVKTFKSGQIGVLCVLPNGTKYLSHIGPGNMLYYRWKPGPGNGIRFDMDVKPGDSSMTTFLSHMASTTWTRDDDFEGLAKTLPHYVPGVTPPRAHKSDCVVEMSGTRRPSDTCDSGGDGDGGDGGDSGDGGDAGDGGDSGDTLSYYMGMTPQQQCEIDRENVRNAQDQVNITAGAAFIACVLSETPPTFALCLIAVAAYMAATNQLETAQKQLQYDNCTA